MRPCGEGDPAAAAAAVALAEMKVGPGKDSVGRRCSFNVPGFAHEMTPRYFAFNACN